MIHDYIAMCIRGRSFYILKGQICKHSFLYIWRHQMLNKYMRTWKQKQTNKQRRIRITVQNKTKNKQPPTHYALDIYNYYEKVVWHASLNFWLEYIFYASNIMSRALIILGIRFSNEREVSISRNGYKQHVGIKSKELP